ncbi:MAG: flavodoxin [Butyricicoccus sp.]
MKTAVAYYSLGGTTRSYARAEAKARNADLIELTPKTPYNRFTAFVRGCLEAVKQKAVALEGMPLFVGYDRVVLMAPVWAGYPRAGIQQRGRAAAARYGGRGNTGFRQRKQ